MAGNHHRDGVRSAGPCHRANRLRRPDPLGDVRVARRRTRGDLPQRLPDALLEGGAAHVEGKVEAERRRFHEADDLGDQLLEPRVAADQPCVRKAVLEVAGKRIRVVAHEDGTDAPLASRHEDGAKRAFADCKAYPGVRAPAR
jgi:hypothetical protein